jgi:Tfp pilus assembly protein PilO
MNFKTKLFLCAAPYIAAAGCAFGILTTAIQESDETSQALEGLKSEQEALSRKSFAAIKAQKKKEQLEKEISSLRDSVPKKPDIDLLNIDLEKMANEAGINFVSFTPPDAEALKRAGLDDKKEPDKKDKTKKETSKTASNKVNPSDLGLEKATMQIKLMGDYPALVEFIHKLESYQRIVGINMMEAYIPKKKESADKAESDSQEAELPDDSKPGEGDLQGDPKQLTISLLVNAYYLP